MFSAYDQLGTKPGQVNYGAESFPHKMVPWGWRAV